MPQDLERVEQCTYQIRALVKHGDKCSDGHDGHDAKRCARSDVGRSDVGRSEKG